MLQRSAIRRLAHDAKKKLPKDAYEPVIDEIRRFISKVLDKASGAARIAKKKTISHQHILFGTEAMQLPLPLELRLARSEDLKKIKRCNYQAPPTQRKMNLLHAEIPHASFKRTIKEVTRENKYEYKVSMSAMVFLQLITEHYIIKLFQNNMESIQETTTVADDMLHLMTITYALECTYSEATKVASFLLRLFNSVGCLVNVCASKSIDSKLIRTAALTIMPDLNKHVTSKQHPRVEKMCEHILRSRSIGFRVSRSATKELSSILQYVFKNDLMNSKDLRVDESTYS